MAYNLDDLILLMDRLRDQEHGCPWDLKQTFETIIPHTLEEAYEVADAIARKDWDELKKELGDLIFQAIFYSKLADEKQWFDFHDVINGLVEKMLRRHPHVFPEGRLRPDSSGKGVPISTPVDRSLLTDQALSQQWNEIKQQEQVTSTTVRSSAMDNLTDGLPGLIKAWKLQKKASSVGFDWNDVNSVKSQLLSELQEVEDAPDEENLEEELGDLLFCCVNLARHHKVHPETALIKANIKFERRFRHMELLAEEDGIDFSSLSLDEQDSYWIKVKQREKAGSTE